MNTPANIELTDNSQVFVTTFDQIASKMLKPALIIFSFFSCLSIGLYKTNYLSESPLVKIASNILGPCAATLSGSIAYIIAFIVPHKYEFAKNVFNISAYEEFKISITLAFLLLPFTIFLVKIINKAFSSYLYRKLIFSITIIITLPILYLTNIFLNKFPDKSAFVFSFVIFGIIYYSIFSCVSNDYRTQIQRMRNI
jgi:hypothetical protein